MAEAPLDNDGKQGLNIFNITNLQIGNDNVMVENNPQKGTLETGYQQARIQLGMHFLRDIFEKYSDKTLPYDDLNKEMQKKIRDMNMDKIKRFKDISGVPLQDFLKQNKDTFEIQYKKRKRYVKLTGNPEKSLPEHGMENVPKQISDQYSVASNETEYFDAFSDLEETTESMEWIKVTRGKRKPNSLSDKDKQYENSSNLTDPQHKCDFKQSGTPTNSTEPQLTFDVNKFKCLIKRAEDRDHSFVLSPQVYKSNMYKFMQDVVSMWNTPQRSNSYIILGICAKDNLPHGLVGIEFLDSNTVYQSLFDEKYFTQRPTFKYYTVSYKRKRFGVIEVLPSYGCGVPSVVKKNGSLNGTTLNENQLWFRQGNRNQICQPANPATANIYHWFLGNAGTVNGNSSSALSKYISISSLACTPSVKSTKTAEACTEKQDNEFRTDTRGAFNEFWNSVNSFTRGHFVLISGGVSNTVKRLEALTLVPWIAVYDFDIMSGSDGILNAMMDFIERRRSLHISTWKDPAQFITEQGTSWCLMRGRREVSDSRTDGKDGSIEDVNTWLRTTKKGIDANCEQLSNFVEDYTVLTFVLFWPTDEKLVPIVRRFVQRLFEHLSVPPKIVLCLLSEPSTEKSRNRLSSFCDDFEGYIDIHKLDIETLCDGIMSSMKNRSASSNVYSLPTADGCDDLSITDRDAMWLKEDLEVLYRDNTFMKGQTDPEELKDAIEKFYRGGTLHWFVRYECSADQVDIERDQMKLLEEKVTKLAEKYKTSVITLAHAPGSGGTTLAQSVLWKLHLTFPCAELKVRSSSNIDELSRKVSFIHQKTHMPVVMMVDGEDESKVRCLSKHLKSTILLYVKRYPYNIPTNIPENKVFLGGNVSASEALVLSSQLCENCDEPKKQALIKLRKEVQSKEQDHYMYEFGMTKYHHEFHGIVSFVRGYLQLESNPTRDLQPWQRCLGYLSLVYYYGQTSVPCQFFAKLMNKAPNHVVSLDDFPHAFRQFVVPERSQGKKNYIRICHFIVAKEILQQLLTRHCNHKSTRTNRLGLDACRNLGKFCMEFIEYAGGKKTRNSTSSSDISYIIARTFIFRDEKDMGDNEEQKRRKPVLSRIMIDIPAGKPLFTERFHVLEKLTQCFPDDPNFHAHLGRFHAFCRPDEEYLAEECFQRAIKLCKIHTEGKNVEDITDRMRQSLMHIYHMYGIIKQRELAKYTGRVENERIDLASDKDNFSERLEELVETAETACSYFKRSREVTPETVDNYVYAYTGEIQVRLQVSEYIKQHFETEKDIKARITSFLYSDANQKAKSFVKASIPIIENLLMDCYTDVELTAEDVRSLQTLILWYNRLFKGHTIPMDRVFECPEDCINSSRLKIAATKLKYGTNHAFGSIEDINDGNDIIELVGLYEDIFQAVQREGLTSQYSRKELERDFRDWIYAIRHEKFPESYKVEDVLETLQLWKNLLHSPLSVYYDFVMQSLLGFGSHSERGKTECLIQANESKDELVKMNRLIIKPKYPREWLGETGEGIKRLLPGNRFVGSSIYLEEKETICVKPSELMVCKGTILRHNTNCVAGFIEMDLGKNSVKVFYIPKKADLTGNRFVGRRVEFFLAFSVDNGYEAYSVKLLKTHGCSKCSARVEFTSVETQTFCKCGTLVFKDALNEVNDKYEPTLR